MKTEKNKQLLIEQLRKTPIILVVCEKTGISRATFYRWYKDDEKFRELVQEALGEGKKLINDMAESQLISLVKDKNFPAISYWLKHNHPDYGNRLELSGKISTQSEKLTPEQEEIVKIALQNAGLIKEENDLS
jgi:AcrR family transcriptional regulator